MIICMTAIASISSSVVSISSIASMVTFRRFDELVRVRVMVSVSVVIIIVIVRIVRPVIINIKGNFDCPD